MKVSACACKDGQRLCAFRQARVSLSTSTRWQLCALQYAAATQSAPEADKEQVEISLPRLWASVASRRGKGERYRERSLAKAVHPHGRKEVRSFARAEAWYKLPQSNMCTGTLCLFFERACFVSSSCSSETATLPQKLLAC